MDAPRFRHIDSTGQEHQYDDARALVEAVQKGEVGADDMLLDAHSGKRG